MKIETLVTGYLEENCYVVSIDNNCIIIDPGDDFEKIKKCVDNKKVLAILITHYHFDHIGALEDAKKCYNVSVVDNKNVGINNIGPFNFEVIETKGHKDDCVSFYFKKYKVMFVGDFIFKGSIGRCDLEGGNEKDMLISLEKIKLFDKDITLYPGHGNKTTIKEELLYNPYMKGNFNE